MDPKDDSDKFSQTMFFLKVPRKRGKEEFREARGSVFEGLGMPAFSCPFVRFPVQGRPSQALRGPALQKLGQSQSAPPKPMGYKLSFFR